MFFSILQKQDYRRYHSNPRENGQQNFCNVSAAYTPRFGCIRKRLRGSRAGDGRVAGCWRNGRCGAWRNRRESWRDCGWRGNIE